MKLEQIRTMISKWVIEDKLNDQEIGLNIRKYYWKEIHSYEHWMNDEEGDGYGGNSSYSNDVGLSGQELDDMYGPI